jgi:hypothetical protein
MMDLPVFVDRRQGTSGHGDAHQQFGSAQSILEGAAFRVGRTSIVDAEPAEETEHPRDREPFAVTAHR